MKKGFLGILAAGLIPALSVFGLTMPIYGAQPSVDFDQMGFDIKEIIEQLGEEADVLPIPCPGAEAATAELQVSRQGNSLVFESPAVFRAASDFYTAAHRNGDVVFLTGKLPDNWTKDEWKRFYSIAKWLVKNDFRVIMNPVAYAADVRASVQDDRTKVIIWSSRANKKGVIFDSGNKPVPDNIFNQSVGRNLRQIIFSTYYGDHVARRYDTPERVMETFWPVKPDLFGFLRTTTTPKLFKYLKSKKWDPREFGRNK